MSNEDTTRLHYWHPIPAPENRRHAFRGARRWPGESSAEAVCGATVAMAVPSETDWIFRPTCPTCWDLLVGELAPGHAERQH